MKYRIILLLTIALAAAMNPVFGQAAESSVLESENLASARTLLQAEREQIFREELRLTDAEAQEFWPLYERYNDELTVVRNRRVEMIANYLRAYRAAELNDEVARALLEDHLDIESDILKIRQKYVRRFQRVISAMKVTRFYQLENKIDAETDAELALVVPLFDPL